MISLYFFFCCQFWLFFLIVVFVTPAYAPPQSWPIMLRLASTIWILEDRYWKIGCDYWEEAHLVLETSRSSSSSVSSSLTTQTQIDLFGHAQCLCVHVWSCVRVEKLYYMYNQFYRLVKLHSLSCSIDLVSKSMTVPIWVYPSINSSFNDTNVRHIVMSPIRVNRTHCTVVGLTTAWTI
jgi:hypothetical protein